MALVLVCTKALQGGCHQRFREGHLQAEGAGRAALPMPQPEWPSGALEALCHQWCVMSYLDSSFSHHWHSFGLGSVICFNKSSFRSCMCMVFLKQCTDNGHTVILITMHLKLSTYLVWLGTACVNKLGCQPLGWIVTHTW